MYSEELFADVNAGRVVLGGCLVTDDDPSHRCNQCGLEHGRVGS